MVNGMKRYLAATVIIGISVVFCGCGDEDKVQPQAPTKYVREADETVDEYNEGVNQINETGDAVENAD